MAQEKPSTNQEVIELRKSGWTFQRIADKFRISREAAHQRFSRWATEEDKRIVNALPLYTRTTIVQFRIKPDLKRRFRKHLRRQRISGADWLEDHIEESIRAAKG